MNTHKKYSPPDEACSKCNLFFTWLFVDNVEEGDIYECERCNNIILKEIEVIEDDN